MNASHVPMPWESPDIPDDVPAHRIYERAVCQGMSQRRRRRRIRAATMVLTCSLAAFGVVAVVTSDLDVTHTPKPGRTAQTVSYTADLNHDGQVNCRDLSILRQQWDRRSQTSTADFNHDGIVDADDLQIMTVQWTGPPTSPALCA